ncbi:hypothetical protein [Paenochrobactrum pullorum]|uniref:hypothetical protein n=1 Tax=Paenochrobactrum pullorum TaxID=1324351 RepID=UPI0035BBD636
MPWLRFTSDFDWSPRYGVTIAYLAGMEMSVTRRCAEAAMKAGKAEKLPTPKREAVNGKS